MNMAKNFQELRAGTSAVAKAASAAEHCRLVEEMSLLQLRKARELTQTKIADELHMGQGDVSKLERRTDMYVSALASYLQAVGADLEIRRGVSRWARCEDYTVFRRGDLTNMGMGTGGESDQTVRHGPKGVIFRPGRTRVFGRCLGCLETSCCIRYGTPPGYWQNPGRMRSL